MEDFHELGSLVMSVVTGPKRHQRDFTRNLKIYTMSKIALGIISTSICGI